MKVFIISAFIIFLIAISGVHAQDFTIQADMSNEYFADKTGLVLLTINNPYQSDNFEVSVVGSPQHWIEPETPNIRVEAGQKKLMLIYVRPSKDATPNNYRYVLKVTRTSSRSSIEEDILINVLQVKDVIAKDFAFSCYSCKDKIVATGKIENIGSDIKNISYQIKLSNLFTREKFVGIIGPGESKSFSEEFDLTNIWPDLYNIELKIWSDSQKILYVDNQLFILSTEKNIVYDEKETSLGPFGTFVTITATNQGNLPDEAQMTSDVNTEWYSLFNGPNPSGNILGNYIWAYPLSPGQSTFVSYSEIFWPTYIFLFLIISGGIIVYWKVVALTVKKVSSKGRLARGEEVSVSLHIRNRSREIDKTIVKDVVPEGFSVTSAFSTVKPVVRKVVEGIELVWNIGKLKKHEERILHYRIKAIRDFAGRIHMPSAAVRAEYEDGRQLLRRSNLLLIHSQPAPVSTISVRVE